MSYGHKSLVQPPQSAKSFGRLSPPPLVAAHDLRLQSVRSVPDYEKKKPVWEQIDGNETNQESINAAKINAKIAGLSNSN